MHNEKGGIISKIFIIPAVVALMAIFFYLGYHAGKSQNKSGVIVTPLPGIASSTGQKQEEFTFYKTLSDKNDRTVSIDLRPKPLTEEFKLENQQTTTEAPKTAQVPSAPAASKQQQSPAKKGPAVASTNVPFRYTVQTGSFPERKMAEDEVKRLKKRGFAAYIVSSEIPGKGVRHRVRIGSFSNKAAAEKLQRAIHKKERILTIVVSE